MATLPDGTAINLIRSESWASTTIAGISKILAEGWESVLLAVGTFTISISDTEVKPGTPITGSGTALDEHDLPVNDVSMVIERPDGVTDSVAATVDSDGNWSAEYAPQVSGDHTTYGETPMMGLERNEPWSSVPFPNSSLIRSDGWEY